MAFTLKVITQAMEICDVAVELRKEFDLPQLKVHLDNSTIACIAQYVKPPIDKIPASATAAIIPLGLSSDSLIILP